MISSRWIGAPNASDEYFDEERELPRAWRFINLNELFYSKEACEAFSLYRAFEFRRAPALCLLPGDVSMGLHLRPIGLCVSSRQFSG
jgi:hypothetical protein